MYVWQVMKEKTTISPKNDEKCSNFIHDVVWVSYTHVYIKQIYRPWRSSFIHDVVWVSYTHVYIKKIYPPSILNKCQSVCLSFVRACREGRGRKKKKRQKRPKHRNFALERRKLKRVEKREKRRKQELSTRPTVGNCVGASSLEIGTGNLAKSVKSKSALNFLPKM